jgi:hypothetical protein
MVVIEVDQEDLPLAVLGLCGAHEPPEGRMREADDLLVGPGSHGAAGEHDELAGGEAVVAEEGLQQRKETAGDVMDSRCQVLGFCRPGDGDDIGDTLTSRDCGLQGGEVGVPLGPDPGLRKSSGQSQGILTEERPRAAGLRRRRGRL